MKTHTKEELKVISRNALSLVCKAFDEIYKQEVGPTRGYYVYYKYRDGNKSVCYTREKANYYEKIGFYSWIETRYKNGKIKRTRIACNRTRKSCEARATRLAESLKNKKLNLSQEDNLEQEK